ncbi:2-dehydro-3-deoxyphosphooctonate aldolase [Candidatus Megaera venefica]|uniref:2-dehydro-3-deoxyphosphooctonate aldolase n=1 Tax=Candidatus Megaera venefica TaxID=2055910 RepID=A0ABU5NB24_9RICK|nr:3-deoxy-8-phosphooctulonate synthase [Candidatus Megaera venefica]MEA0970346.1 2-dehydro-3-deoxyphosphooctonate aldolase [Candidatus Megaera venefica]
MNNIVKVADISIANNLPFVLVAGPCQIETLDHALFIAESIKKITNKLGISFIYKSSFDKANRTSAKAQRGTGIDEGLNILAKVKSEIGCPILTDIHNEGQCKPTAEVVDVLQIPAFLCRQTDLLKAAADTGRVVKVKKGQFLAPWDMKNVYDKLVSFNAKGIILTDRGTSFGYNTLISDMRGLEIMAETGAPVFFDATHSVQQPGGIGSASGGQRQYVELLARCAIAAGIAGVYLEVHQDPDNAPSDGPCMLKLESLEKTISTLKKFDELRKNM